MAASTDAIPNGAAAAGDDKPAASRTRKVVGFVASQWLTFGFGLACLLAHFFPCRSMIPFVMNTLANHSKS